MTSLCHSILITGTSRGIGLEFVKQISNLPSPPEVLIATCRNPSDAASLQEFAKDNLRIKVMKMDVENDEDIDTVVKETRSLVGEHGLNLLINNAGIYLDKSKGGNIHTQTRELMQRHFNVNVTSPIMITQKFLPLLEQAVANAGSLPLGCSKAASIVISSRMGSQTMAYHTKQEQRGLQYKCSKSAVNMACVLMSQDLKEDGVLVLAMHPGWVKTEMGGDDASLTVKESVAIILQTLTKVGEKEAGRVINWKGEALAF